MAPGVLWLRLPLPIAMDHVNAFALDDGDGWTLVDPGADCPGVRAALDASLASPRMAGKPVTRVIATHHHPDHIGMAGHFIAQGARLWTTRTAWLMARAEQGNRTGFPDRATVAYWKRAGMPAEQIAQREKTPEKMSLGVAPLPLGYRRIAAGEVISAAGRRWRIETGEGHAPEHAVLWSLDDDLVIGGDQLLPSISANLGVWPTEPEADPVGDWIESCRRFLPLAEDRHLVLPGHRLPYTGLPLRLNQMIDSHLSALDRLRETLAKGEIIAPKCFPILFRRAISEGIYTLALAEALGNLNYLMRRAEVRRITDGDGVWRWSLWDTQRAGQG